MNTLTLSPLMVAVGLLLAGQPAQASTYAWNCTSGNWATATCWSPNGVPGTSPLDYAYISASASDMALTFDATTVNRTVAYLGMGMNATSGMATINQSMSNLTVSGSQTIGYRGSATYNQNSGANQTHALYVGAEATALGAYNLYGGSTTQTTTTYIGQAGSGTFTNHNGTHNANAIVLGGLSGGNGSYSVRNSATTWASNLFIGQAGTGTFTQLGGTVNVAGTVSMGSSGGSGSLSISAGQFNTSRLQAGTSSGGSGSITLSAGTLYTSVAVLGAATDGQASAVVSGGRWEADIVRVGDRSTAGVTQSGGLVAVTQALVLGAEAGSSGAYTLSGAGVLQAGSLVVGRSGTASFVQGLNTSVTLSGNLVIAEADNSAGVYTLNGGTLATGGIVNNGVLYQNGGSMSGAMTNNGTYSYSGGAVAGRITNNGSLVLNADASFADGLENNSSLHVSSVRVLDLAGTASVNNGSLSLSGGRINQAGGLRNEGLVSGYGSVGGAGDFANNGVLQVSSGNLALSTTGTNTNTGTMTLSTGRQLQLASGTTLDNTGSLELASGQVAGAGQLTNALGGSVTGRGTISSRFANAGYLGVGAGTTGVTRGFVNTGVVDLGAAGANLTGGVVQNDGTIQGLGNVTNQVNNGGRGTIEAIGGTLSLAHTGNTNGGTLAAGAGAKILFVNGLPSNEGLIQITGGTFDNGGRTLVNTEKGAITGQGTVRTGELVNQGAVNLSFGNSTVSGAIDNQAQGKVVVSNGAQVTFANGLRNNGELRVSEGGSANFFGTVSGAGSFTGTGQSRYESGFAPGNSPAVVSLSGESIYASSSWIEMELGGTTPGSCATCADKIIFNNSVTLQGGALNVLWWSGFSGHAGDVFDLFDWNGTLTGSFGAVWLPTLTQGLLWDTSSLYTTGELRISAVPEPETWALAGAGLIVAGALARRRQPGRSLPLA